MGNLRQKHYLADLDIDGRIVLKWILQKGVGGSGTELMWLSLGRGGRALMKAVLNFRAT